MRKALAQLVLVFVGMTVAAVILEVFLNAQAGLKQDYYVRTQAERGQITLDYGQEFVERFNRDDPLLGKRHAANANLRSPFRLHPSGYLVYRTNNLGLRRDEDTPIAKPAGVLRILVLGDSMTDGVVYNHETYSAILETLLNQTPVGAGKRVEALNAGEAGYSTLQEYLALKLERAKLQPDLIIVGLYTGNDISDIAEQRDDPQLATLVRELSADARDPNLLLETDPGSQIKWYLRRHLRLYPVLWQIKEALARANTSPTAPARNMRGAIMDQMLGQAILAKTNPRIAQAALRLEELTLLQFDQLARSLNAQFLVVIIPTKLQVEPQDDQENIDGLANAFGLQDDELHFDKQVAERMLNFCRANQIPVLDLEPALGRAAEKGTPLYWQPNWHLNPEGNAVVAEEIYRYLQTHSSLLAK